MYRSAQKPIPDLKPGDEYISLADQGLTAESMHMSLRQSLPADPGASSPRPGAVCAHMHARARRRVRVADRQAAARACFVETPADV